MIGVVGITFDEFSSFLHGPEKAPPLIRHAFHSDSSNYFTESGVDLKGHPGWRDLGDMHLPSGKEAIEAISIGIEQSLTVNDKILSLGGDHSVTYPIVKAIARRYPKLNILHLDAHPDLYDQFEGNRFSHACPFARIMEEGLASRLVQVGIRTMNSHQKNQAERFGVEVFEMSDWQSYREVKFDGPVYISLDLDALDPAFAPGVSHYEPGGFSTRELIFILQGIQAEVIGADLVEYNPTRDTSGVTAMVAAKLFKELLDVMLRT